MVELLTSALELSWLVQISDLTRTGTQSEAIVLPEDLVGDRLRAQHLPDQVSYNHRLGRVQWVRVLSEVERMRSTSDDLQRTHSAVLVGSSQRDGAELRQKSIKRVEVRISVQQCDTVPSRDDRDEAINQAMHGVSPSATGPIGGGRGVEVQAHIDVQPR